MITSNKVKVEKCDPLDVYGANKHLRNIQTGTNWNFGKNSDQEPKVNSEQKINIFNCRDDLKDDKT